MEQSSNIIKRGHSADGSAWAALPPIVPELRIVLCAVCSKANEIIGKNLVMSFEVIAWLCVTKDPISNLLS